ncbi:MAG: hypothetical protein KW806_01035 [Candidatus Yanofskybacteria bacterium]|nr:hypothetical protein [Candidatus Yanofskybacteria bacterium]
MLELTSASNIVQSSLLTLWSGVAGFVPRLIAAVLVFLVGWLIATLLGRVAFHVFNALRIDSALTRVGFRQAWERSGFRLNSAHFFQEIVKWFFIIVFLMAATNILGLDQVSEFLRTVVFYIPNVVVAAFILLIGILVAKFLESTVRASVRAAGLASGNFLGALTKWAIFVFSLLVALSQLEVAAEIIRIVVIGMVAAVSIGVGLAFGLGGTKHADEMLHNLRRRIQD